MPRQWLVLGLFVASAAAWFICPVVFPLDDPYIALHSAQVAISGHDDVYRSNALVGATSPVHVALLALTLWFNVPPLIAVRIVAAAGIGVFLVALASVGRQISVFFAAVLSLSALAILRVPALNGLETIWAIGLATIAMDSTRRQRFDASAAAIGLMPFVRPDLAPAAVALAAWNLMRTPHRSRWLLIAGLCATPWAVWLLLDTGYPWPSTMAAKVAFLAEACLPRSTKTEIVLPQVIVFALMLGPLLLGLAGWRGRLQMLPWLAIGVTLVAYWQFLPVHFNSNQFRYLYACVVPWCLAGWPVIATGSPRSAPALLITAAFASIVTAPKLPSDAGQEMLAMTNWVRHNTAPDATLLVQDAGMISVLGGRSAVDFVGLKTPSSIRVHQAVTAPSCGERRGEAIASIARTAHADYLITSSDWESELHLKDAVERAGIALHVEREAPSGSGYFVYKVEETVR